MKILDRYIAVNFLVGYAIAFSVLIGLWTIIDLFVNLDEFAEHIDMGAWAIARNILTYYGLNMTLYFRDLAGVITVVAAAFSLGRMVRTNELVAMIASGVSAQRIVGPVLVLAILFTGLWVVDQELLIPSISDRLMRKHGDVPGQEYYRAQLIVDGNGSLIYSGRFDVKTSTFYRPMIITRRATDHPGIWVVTGRITADNAVFNDQTGAWDLVNGVFVGTGPQDMPRPVTSYSAPNLLPKDVPIICESRHASLFSSRELSALAAQSTRIRDVAQLSSLKHFRITDPIINLTMLMVSLPVLICRDPRMMKSRIMVSFVLTATCFVVTFLCKMLATEVVIAGRVMPELWAWLPLFIFLPVAFVELDTIQT
ncbi:MAG: LptF/LptG family permease [Sedimentisphaerales bacterium]|nr:LptF/LptG family permease [Sedimentisphaerales bacterium]